MTDERREPDQRQTEQRARELLEGGDEGMAPVADDEATARAAALRILEDSEQRVADPAARDVDDDSVIRRSSEETAS